MNARWILFAAMGCNGSSTPATPDASTSIPAHAVLRGRCTQMIATDGGPVFPSTSTLQTAVRQIELFNDGPVAIRAKNATIEGPDAADFTLLSMNGPGTSDCTGLSFGDPELSIGGECDLRLTFHPTTPVDKQAVLHLTVTGDYISTTDWMVPIHATAIAPIANVTTDAPDVSLFAQATATFTILNNGTSTVTVGDPVVTPAAFTFKTWNCPGSLTPGGACTATVGFDDSLIEAGCPTGTFSTSTSAFTEPLAGLVEPESMLTVATSDPALGSVHVTPHDLDCPGAPEPSCTYSFDPLTQITVTAVPQAGRQFSQWFQNAGVDAGCGTDPVCTLPVGFYKISLEAQFVDPTLKHINLSIVGHGSVNGPAMTCTQSCVFSVAPGGGAVLSEQTTGTFTGWSGDCSGTDDCQLGTIINDRNVTATFSP